MKDKIFPVRNLTVGLYGSEEVSFIRKIEHDDSTEKIPNYGYHEVIRLEVTLDDLPDGPPRCGVYNYPFTL